MNRCLKQTVSVLALVLPFMFVASAVISLSLAATGALAQTANPPTGKSPEAKPSAPSVEEFDKQMGQPQETMKKMQEEMDKIPQTQDPQERQKLLQEHWAAMQNAMGMMRGPMMGMGMMGGHMMGGPMMWGDYRRLTPEQLKERQYMMNRMMGMQQMMMDQIMEHHYWMMPQTQPPPK